MAESKQYFEEVAEDWDQMRTDFFSEKVREIAYDTAQIRAGESAVDVGAGTGFISEGLLNAGVRVIAVDQSNAMLNEMKRKFGTNEAIEYRLAQADDRLPLPDCSVQYAFANMYLHHVEYPLQAIKEMVRVIETDGRVVITDLAQHDHTFLCEEHNDRWMGFDREDISRWFREAGLKDVIVDCVGEACHDTSCDASDSASISIFVASGVK